MNSKRWFVIFGTLLSITLLVLVFANLDWQTFFVTLTTIELSRVLIATILILIIVSLRSLRWNLVAGIPLSKFKYFWQAASIGYLGNLIYPARAGEVLRTIAVHRFVPLSLGRAITSTLIDRMLDVIMLGVFTLVVLWLHSSRIDANIGRGVISVFVIALVSLIILVVYASRWQNLVKRLELTGKWSKRFQEGTLHFFEGIIVFRQTGNLLWIFLIGVSVSLVDYFWMWQMMKAFGWSLPFEAAVTTGVFIILGASLPSAPGYVGVFQVACVLALHLYGVDQTLAVAYSIAVQLLSSAIVAIQGTLVAIYCGFNFSRESTESLDNRNISL